MRLTFVVCNQNDDGSIVCIGQHSWRLAARYDLWDKDDISVSLKGRPKDSFPIMSSAGKELVCELILTLSATRRTPHATNRGAHVTAHIRDQQPIASSFSQHALYIAQHTSTITLEHLIAHDTCRTPLAQPIVDQRPGNVDEDRGTLSFQLKSVPLLQSHSGWMERKEKKYGFGVR